MRYGNEENPIVDTLKCRGVLHIIRTQIQREQNWVQELLNVHLLDTPLIARHKNS